MRNSLTLLILAGLGSTGFAQAQDRVGVRVLLGVTDQESTPWDGSLPGRGAQIAQTDPWGFDAGDAISGNTWKVSTHPAELFLGGIFYSAGKSPIVPNGIVAQLTGVREEAELQVSTSQ